MAIFQLRPARLDERATLENLIAVSARALGRSDYSAAQIEAALGSVFGVDSELIRDGTYLVAEADESIVACGGWSKRKTLYGGDGQPGRESALLDPAHDAARVRAFFVHPQWTRLGIGRALIARCEDEARGHGFRSMALWRHFRASGCIVPADIRRRARWIAPCRTDWFYPAWR